MVDTLYLSGLSLINEAWWTAIAWPVVWTLIKIVVVLLPLMGCVAYLTLWERKAIGFTQVRVGPNRTGPFGLLQPIAVRRVGDRYQLIAGERRLRAATMADWQMIPARVLEADDRQLVELAIVENLQRKDLNPLEKEIGRAHV